MTKDSFYFQHDYNARNDQKILQLRSEFGYEGYGLYWAILETMAETNDGYIIAPLMGGLSVGLGVAKDRLLATVDFCVETGLFKKDSKGIYSPRMNEHKKQRKLFSDSGKEGAARRWKNSPLNSPPNNRGNAKERKGKDRIEEESKDVQADGAATSFLQLFKQVAPKNLTNETLVFEVGEFMKKYPNVTPEKSNRLVLAWVTRIKGNIPKSLTKQEEYQKKLLKAI